MTERKTALTPVEIFGDLRGKEAPVRLNVCWHGVWLPYNLDVSESAKIIARRDKKRRSVNEISNELQKLLEKQESEARGRQLASAAANVAASTLGYLLAIFNAADPAASPSRSPGSSKAKPGRRASAPTPPAPSPRASRSRKPS